MRIIAGEFRSRRLLTPKDDAVTRPIPDRVKESLFGLLRGHCEGANVFDGFAGTGAIGLEALSRGAARCVCVERDKGAAELLKGNIEALGVQDRCELVIGDALGPGALARAPRPLTIAFLDPPYPLIREPIGWDRVRAQLQKLVDLLTDDGFAIVRTPWPFMLEVRQASEEAPEPVRKRIKKKRHGHDRAPRQGRWHEAPPAPEETIEALAPGPEEGGEVAAEAGPNVVKMAPDLGLPNAAGPETHVYASTAVHLYMKKRA